MSFHPRFLLPQRAHELGAGETAGPTFVISAKIYPSACLEPPLLGSHRTFNDRWAFAGVLNFEASC
jgi:hypothetical protein